MTAPAIITSTVRCKVCDHPTHPTEASGDPSRLYTCPDCMRRHYEALHLLQQQITAACATDIGQLCHGCQRDGDARQRDTGTRSLYIHTKDGMLLTLCRRCSDRYIVAATNLYRDTAFGWAAKLR